MRKLISIGLIVVLCISAISDIQKKIIRQNGFDIECYVSLKPLENYNKTKMYHWFKAGKLHNTLGKSGGLVLHQQYLKFHRSNQLVEEGSYDFGLKDGEWKTWYDDGKLKTSTRWANGFKQGKFLSFDSSGKLEQSGNFNKNRKSGRWINHKLRDTTYIKNDSVFKERPPTKAGKFLDRIFKKTDSLEKRRKKLERINKRRTDSIVRAKKKQNKRKKDTVN